MAQWRNNVIGASKNVRQLLESKDSLTQKLRECCVRFEVQGVRQRLTHAFPDELRISMVSANTHAWVRDVRLTCAGVTLVFAHSVLPVPSLVGTWKQLLSLGSRPLGASLFADRRVKRSALQYCRVGIRHPLYRQVARNALVPPPFLWARRSRFRRGNRHIVVTEVFMPEAFNLYFQLVEGSLNGRMVKL